MNDALVICDSCCMLLKTDAFIFICPPTCKATKTVIQEMGIFYFRMACRVHVHHIENAYRLVKHCLFVVVALSFLLDLCGAYSLVLLYCYCCFRHLSEFVGWLWSICLKDMFSSTFLTLMYLIYIEYMLVSK